MLKYVYYEKRALAVTEEHYIPLLHRSYERNMNDSKVFGGIIESIKHRMDQLKIDTTQHAIVFDRGCNSKQNLKGVNDLNLHYVGALTPSHHNDFVKKLLHGQFMDGLISYELEENEDGRWKLNYQKSQNKLEELEYKLGYRIVMTNRHDWNSEKIINTK